MILNNKENKGRRGFMRMIGSAGLGLGLGVVTSAAEKNSDDHSLFPSAYNDDNQKKGIYDVKNYGARGDGLSKDTMAIQEAIDTCSDKGGGRVLLSPGCYLSGTLHLKSNIELHLSSGATLLGSPDREDYFDAKPHQQDLIRADEQYNVSITGKGIIDGNSKTIVPCFWEPLPEGAVNSYRIKTIRYLPNWSGEKYIIGWRPNNMLTFFRCSRVYVQGVNLINSPNWNLLLHRCNDVQISGITIDNPPSTKNGDGINIDSSRNVMVSNCIIRSGDDCITLKAGESDPKYGGLDAIDAVCENITITNCVLSTPACAFRIGNGYGRVRYCRISNIVIPENRTGINFDLGRNIYDYSHDPALNWLTGFNPALSCVEQVHFSDFTMDSMVPIVITIGGDADPDQTAIQDISFSRFHIRGSAGSHIAGTTGIPVRRVRFSDVEWHLHGGTDNRRFVEERPSRFSPNGFTGYHHSGIAGEPDVSLPALPSVLYGVRLEDCSFDNIRVYWKNPGKVWQYGFTIEQSKNVDFRNAILRQPQLKGAAALKFAESNRIKVTGCQASEGTDTFIHITDSSSDAAVRCMNNDYSNALHPVVADLPVREAGNLYP